MRTLKSRRDGLGLVKMSDSSGDISEKNQNLFDKFSHFCDSHVSQLKRVYYLAVGLGLLAVGRKIRLAKRFTSVDSIPDHFITKRIKLRGEVTEIKENGVLMVDHLPILSMSKVQSDSSKGSLTIALAGVLTNDATIIWLKQHVLNKHVWFQVLRQNLETNSIDCFVYCKLGWLRHTCLSTHLIKNGLAEVSICDELLNNNLYKANVQKLLDLEKKAEKKRLGMWKKPPVLRRAKESMWETVGGVKSNLQGKLRRIFGRGKEE